MADPLTAAQFCDLVRDRSMLVFLIGPEKKQYIVHRNLVHSVAWIFDTPHTSDPTVDRNLRELRYVDTYIFDEFVVWLYDRSRTFELEDEIDLCKLVRLYDFAETWSCEPLKDSIIASVASVLESEETYILDIIAEVHRCSEPLDKKRLAWLLDGVSEQLVSTKQPTLTRLLDIYMWAINWPSNKPKNVVMDAIRDVMHETFEMLTLEQAKRIFRECEELDISTEDERIRKLFIAIFHHRRFGFASGGQLQDADAADFFTEIPNFLGHYMEFEHEVLFGRISADFKSGDDPRNRSLTCFPPCYFHVHDENNCEVCHLPPALAKIKE